MAWICLTLFPVIVLIRIQGVTGIFGQYVGCFGDQWDPRASAMQGAYVMMTLDLCNAQCQSATFFGVEYYDQCYCDESYDRYGWSSYCDNQYRTPCRGNESQTCGGYQALSVYLVADVDECDTNNGDCQQTCTNAERSYQCSCWTGYTLNSEKCHDINECNTTTHGCQYNCTNTDGSYMCSCPAGYALAASGRNCTDINECTSGTCSHRCTNTIGSYNCSCMSGWVLNDDGRTCDDFDECTSNVDNCEQKCTNTEGSFTCSCEVGYELHNTTSCTKNPETSMSMEMVSQAQPASSSLIVAAVVPSVIAAAAVIAVIVLAIKRRSQSARPAANEDASIHSRPPPQPQHYESVDAAAINKINTERTQYMELSNAKKKKVPTATLR